MFEIRRYRTAAGDEPVTKWLSDLRDRQAQARILARLERLEVGNFGDAKFLRDGVHEMESIGARATGFISVVMGGP